MNQTSRPAAPAVPARAAPRVLMLGTAPGGRGGVATVVTLLRQDGLFEREGVCYVPTHAEGSRADKARAALSGLARTVACLLRRPEVVHAHAASNASFVRKSALLALARLAGCKTVFHLHGACFDTFTEQSGPLMRRWTCSSSPCPPIASRAWGKRGAIAASASTSSTMPLRRSIWPRNRMRPGCSCSWPSFGSGTEFGITTTVARGAAQRR